MESLLRLDLSCEELRTYIFPRPGLQSSYPIVVPQEAAVIPELCGPVSFSSR